jgi:hypothetical protein
MAVARMAVARKVEREGEVLEACPSGMLEIPRGPVASR